MKKPLHPGCWDSHLLQPAKPLAPHSWSSIWASYTPPFDFSILGNLSPLEKLCMLDDHQSGEYRYQSTSKSIPGWLEDAFFISTRQWNFDDLRLRKPSSSGSFHFLDVDANGLISESEPRLASGRGLDFLRLPGFSDISVHPTTINLWSKYVKMKWSIYGDLSIFDDLSIYQSMVKMKSTCFL